MTQDRESTNGQDGNLRQFEKNRFFQGKLMTARDMETEQRYHSNRLHTLNLYATGKGILHGVEISAVEESETELEVTLEPGIVIDGYGRPIVIEHTTTKTLPVPSGDELYLFLRYDETELETVPVPDARGSSNEEYMSNRIVEAFELTYQESPPEEWDPIPDVDTSAEGTDDDTSLRALANRYHQRNRTPHEPVEDPSVFIGAFDRTRDGTWIMGSDTVRRQLVYDNDMLYSALINHITDTEDPHGMVGGSGDLEDAEEIRAEVQAVSEQIDTLNRYVMRKSLKDKIRFFDDVSKRFEDHDTSGSRIAQEIVEKAKTGMNESAYDDPEEYRDLVGEMLELDINLGEALEASATEDSLENYVKAVNDLQAVLADEERVLRVAEAQDGVCEAADSLEVLYGVVPEG